MLMVEGAGARGRGVRRVTRGQVGRVGGPLLRDRNKALYANPERWDGEAAGSVRDERVYYCTDYQGSVVALVGPGGALVEQARYSANGVSFGLPLGDVDADGDCDGADDTLHKAIEMSAVYDVRADLDLDGDVDSADWAIVTAGAGEVLGWGRLSTESIAARLTSASAVWISEHLVGEHGFIRDALVELPLSTCPWPEGPSEFPYVEPWATNEHADLQGACAGACARFSNANALAWCVAGRRIVCVCSRSPSSPGRVEGQDFARQYGECQRVYEWQQWAMGVHDCPAGYTGFPHDVPGKPESDLQKIEDRCRKAYAAAAFARCLRSITCVDGPDGYACRLSRCRSARQQECLGHAWHVAYCDGAGSLAEREKRDQQAQRECLRGSGADCEREAQSGNRP